MDKETKPIVLHLRLSEAEYKAVHRYAARVNRSGSSAARHLIITNPQLREKSKT